MEVMLRGSRNNKPLKGAIEEPLPAETEDTMGSVLIVATS